MREVNKTNSNEIGFRMSSKSNDKKLVVDLLVELEKRLEQFRKNETAQAEMREALCSSFISSLDKIRVELEQTTSEED